MTHPVFPYIIFFREKEMFECANWLDAEEKTIIDDVLQAPYLQGLMLEQKVKLKALLYSILYAEKKLDERKRKVTLFCEKILHFFFLTPYFCKTLGIWGINICHAERFQFSVRHFKKILFDKTISTKIVIRHILEDIKLSKDPALIFAEYNLRTAATTVAAFQKLLNFLQGKKEIDEDGILGSKTFEAFKKCSPYFPSFFCYEKIDEEMILKALQYFNYQFLTNIYPFVPQVKVKKDIRFFFSVIFNPKKWKKISKVFANHIDVVGYVHDALEAYEKLHVHADPLL